MDRLTEVGIKLERVRKYLNRKHYKGVLLSSAANFAWLTAGGDSHVENDNKLGVASLFVTENKTYIITNNIEAERLLTEELSGVETEFEFAVSNWYDPSGEREILEKLISGGKAAADSAKEGMATLSGDFISLRYELTEREIERYRWLGKHCGKAIESVGRELNPGMSEQQIEAAIAQKMLADGIQPVVILVAGDDRNFKYRHPVPTDNRFTKFAKLICCARKWGLITSLTRSVYVGAVPDDLKEKQDAVVYVDAVYMNSTKPGTVAGKIIDDAKAAYEKVGYADEWRLHHQGGAIGYSERDYIGISESKEIVVNHQAFTWNPSIQGNKSEDTMIVSHGAPELITMTGDWPVIEVTVDGMAFIRPAILEIK